MVVMATVAELDGQQQLVYIRCVLACTGISEMRKGIDGMVRQSANERTNERRERRSEPKRIGSMHFLVMASNLYFSVGWAKVNEER